MRRSICGPMLCVAVLLAMAATVEATPILPADISVGAPVTGSFSFRIPSNPPDQEPAPFTGRYQVPDPTARMVVEIGGHTFRSNADVIFEVTNSLGFDGIGLQATGDPTIFPFLTGLAHQDPAFDPLGFTFLRFNFPPGYLSSDAFTTAIDPLATARNPGGPTPTGIYQRVEGVSRRSPTSAMVEWLFQFDIDPLSFHLTVLDGELTGTYAGTVAFLRPGEFTPNAPVPEPSSIILALSGWLLLRRTMSSRSRQAAGQ